MFRRYGTVFVETTLSGARIVSIADKAALEEVLRISSRKPYRPPTEIVEVYRKSRPDRYSSTGLVNEQGDKWLLLRRNLTGDLTSPHTIHSFIPELNTICDDFLELLQLCRKPDGAVYGFDQIANKMGLESICGLMLGTRFGFLQQCMTDDRAILLAAAVKNNFRALRDSYYGVPVWKHVPTALYSNFVKSEETIHLIVSQLMDEAKLRTSDLAHEGMREIFLNILENPVLDERDKKAAVIDFVTAGIETLSNSLIFLLYLLSGRRDWQQRIHDELPASSIISAAELAATPSVKAAATEAFRLLPTAALLARVLEEPLEVHGYTLPVGTFVFAHTGAACRREENFWKAKEYHPERWLKIREPHTPSLVAPFGRGRRMCPGKRFVELELNVILAKIMQRWRVEMVHELDIEFDFLVSPKSPVSLRLVEW